ncbi:MULTISPECIES: GNAT family N-acetyltransferase [unclassified Paenibacillus]|uniref:GNAT family N-acetyltransferase n=1 Tax=unclassified Paenibacillus TaxID=185978 RepID=UPI0024071380|nr:MULTISPECIES: GNAT family N-acetyltransferase [unclassified Paenibacillus]
MWKSCFTYSKLANQKANERDWDAIKSIYEEGIQTGNATFETNAPSKEQWFSSHNTECSIVCLDDEEVVGWASLSSVSSRCVYAGVGEDSIYVTASARGKGIGHLLLGKLVEKSEENGFWTIQTGIFPENMMSISLHAKHGFREIGLRKKVGKMNGVWRDVLFMERRSEIVGID